MNAPRPEDAKSRLLHAAGRVIARKGYEAASIREICREANANVAAVHYHFGDKKTLYAALLLQVFEKGMRQYPPLLGLPQNAPAEQRLAAFIRSFFLRMFAAGHPDWYPTLVARELAEPSEVFAKLTDELFTPLLTGLKGLVREILGAKAPPDWVEMCVFSIAGQCQYCCRPAAIVTRLHPDIPLDGPDVRSLSTHVLRFSLAALRGYNQTVPPGAPEAGASD